MLHAGPVPNASAWLSAQAGNQGSSNDCQLQCDTPQDLASLTPQQKLYINPPYQINNANGQPIDQRTLGVTAVHADGSLEYNAHNLYGLSEADATYGALQHITGKRPFMLTRCASVASDCPTPHPMVSVHMCVMSSKLISAVVPCSTLLCICATVLTHQLLHPYWAYHVCKAIA